jgi:hypothetical protein
VMSQSARFIRMMLVSTMLGMTSLAYGASSLSTVKQCTLNVGGAKVSLLRTKRIGDTFKYLVRMADGPAKPIFDGDDDQARGTLIKATCVGSASARVLVVSGEFFGSGYPKGFALAWNEAQHKVERIDFAERAFPSQVYLNSSGMSLLIPTRGGDATAKFVLYQHDAISDKTDTIPVEAPPKAIGLMIKVD